MINRAATPQHVACAPIGARRDVRMLRMRTAQLIVTMPSISPDHSVLIFPPTTDDESDNCSDELKS